MYTVYPALTTAPLYTPHFQWRWYGHTSSRHKALRAPATHWHR